MKLGDGQQKPHGTWDYFGEGDPGRRNHPVVWETFSVGVFQWWNKKSGGTKKLPAIKKIRGRTSNPKEVYRKALALISEKKGGE